MPWSTIFDFVAKMLGHFIWWLLGRKVVTLCVIYYNLKNKIYNLWQQTYEPAKQPKRLKGYM